MGKRGQVMTDVYLHISEVWDVLHTSGHVFQIQRHNFVGNKNYKCGRIVITSLSSCVPPPPHTHTLQHILISPLKQRSELCCDVGWLEASFTMSLKHLCLHAFGLIPVLSLSFSSFPPLFPPPQSLLLCFVSSLLIPAPLFNTLLPSHYHN